MKPTGSLRIATALSAVLSLMLLSCGDDDGGGSVCPTGQTLCDDRCVDLQTDRDHCQSCGAACEDGFVCGAGQCELSCQDGLVACDGSCVDPQTDRDHCGASGDCQGANGGTACADGMVCDGAGTCAVSCLAGLVECAGSCVDPQTDRDHCGASGDCQGTNAGVTCEAGFLCDAGLCALSCQADLLECDGVCVDPLSNPDYCGASGDCQGMDAGEACVAGTVCEDGACTTTCLAGLVTCDGTCIDPQTDRDHCGATGDCLGQDAGEVCDDGYLCDGGLCTLSCQAGLVTCDGTCIDPQSDRDHCGASGDCLGQDAGEVCGDGYLCDGGQCTLSCQAGLVTCDGSCIDPQSNPDHCGASGDCMGPLAGDACSAHESCVDGVCERPLPTGSVTFDYTGAPVTFVVPASVSTLTVVAYGAEGGASEDGTPGGLGGKTTALVAVTPGETLLVYVGGAGFTSLESADGGWNGGGGVIEAVIQGTGDSGTGGGASDVRRGTALADRLVVAGGGGGGGWASRDGYGGDGGGLVGADGNSNHGTYTAGGGGTQTAGGAVGWATGSYPNEPGTFGRGGDGYHDGAACGGGGGGWYGGGAGGFAGGGGGSGYAGAAGTTPVSLETGVRSGNGLVTIIW